MLSNYFKNRSVGWWISSGLFAVIMSILLVPSWRMGFASWIGELTLSDPKLLEKRVELPQDAYMFSYKDVKQEKHFLNSYKGEVVFINFWATWCHHCVAEMSSIDRLYNEFGDKVHFIIYSNEKMEVQQSFKNKKNYSLPFASPYYELPTFFAQTRGIPMTYIISKKGEVVVAQSGAAQWDSDNIKNLLNKLIEE